MQIKKLTPDLLNDFLYYFDHIGFTDNPDWAGCYCLESHMTEAQQEKLKPLGIPGRREKAKELILSGVMQGYLAYEDGKPVAWCNADDKCNYCGVHKCNDFCLDTEDDTKIKVAYCFDIAPDYRRKGIASQFLQHVCEEAKKEGYEYIEGYPRKGEEGVGEHQYHGPVGLYRKMGFEVIKESEKIIVMRKKLY